MECFHRSCSYLHQFISQDKQLMMIKVAALTSVMINDDADEQQKLLQP